MPLKDLRKRLAKLAAESKADGYSGLWMRERATGEVDLHLSIGPDMPAGGGWEPIEPANAGRLRKAGKL
jgi:hypothetical protein